MTGEKALPLFKLRNFYTDFYYQTFFDTSLVSRRYRKLLEIPMYALICPRLILFFIALLFYFFK